MCGIVGRLNFLSQTPVDKNCLERMAKLLAHRGPDGEGVYVDGPLGLGHRRLAVLDLSSAGHQPMGSEDKKVWITYNGELYNFRELRTRLESFGHRFHSQSDTEVVLVSYQHYGVKCVDYFLGMFAFAIWDSRNQSLFLARDRVGKKPLFYWTNKNGLAFASEPKAFLADPTFESEPNVQALRLYLTTQYVPTPLSAFKGVHKIPPSHYMLIKDGRIEIKRYWQLSYQTTFVGSEEEAEQELLAKLTKAVELRLVSDVPLGAFLSGGVDSSLIVALMAQLGTYPLKTFSIGFEQKQFNELPYAQMVAKRYQTDHQEFIVSPKASEMFSKLVWHYGEPFGDSSAIPSFYLSHMTKQYVTVTLNGDGGDENLAGYDRYVANVFGEFLGRMPLGIRQGLQMMGAWLPHTRNSKGLRAKLKRFLSELHETPERRYENWMTCFGGSLMSGLCSPEFLSESANGTSWNSIQGRFEDSDASTLLEKMLDVDVHTYLPDDLLVKVDVATMAYGLEARSPFLDQEVMEFCASLPAHMKLRGRSQKYLVKKAAQKFLPPEIIGRPKMGFGVPLEDWFRGDLRELAHDILLSNHAKSRGYFKEKVVRQLLTEHAQGKRLWHNQLWNLLMLELWFRMFIDGEWKLNYQVA